MMNQAVLACEYRSTSPFCAAPHIGRMSGTAAREAGHEDEMIPSYVCAEPGEPKGASSATHPPASPRLHPQTPDDQMAR
jgi:hypothetical protein